MTQRPMAMYHSWGSQNAWLRQLHASNRLYVAEATAQALGIEDDDWVFVESPNGSVRAQVRRMRAVNEHTVWTWNAIGKRRGAWNLAPDAPEGTRGFLLNDLIAELLPERGGGYRYANADPITGQAAWYDLRVRLRPADGPGDRAPPLSPPSGRPRPPRRAPLRRAVPAPAEPLRPLRPRAGAGPARRGGLVTALPDSTRRRLGLVIDLDTCVGCHACVVHCKEWNTGGYPAPLSDTDPYGADPTGTWLNRVHSYEVETPGRTPRVVHFPKSCLHCEDAPCVTVCPTGASYKRTEDGIRARGRGPLHRLQAVCVGLSVRGPRVRRRDRG